MFWAELIKKQPIIFAMSLKNTACFLFVVEKLRHGLKALALPQKAMDGVLLYLKQWVVTQRMKIM